MWVVGPRPGPADPTSQKVLMDKNGDGQVAGFSRKLMRHWPITNVVNFKIE
jgi:hypothetical protein